MVAILHCLIIRIEYDRIKEKLLVWQLKKNLNKFNNIILDKVKLFKYFSKVSLFKNHLDKINKNDFVWGSNWD